MHRHILIPLPKVSGVDMSITNDVVLIWAAAAVTFIVVTLACRRRGPIARGMFQNFFEVIIEFNREPLAKLPPEDGRGGTRPSKNR